MFCWFRIIKRRLEPTEKKKTIEKVFFQGLIRCCKVLKMYCCAPQIDDIMIKVIVKMILFQRKQVKSRNEVVDLVGTE